MLYLKKPWNRLIKSYQLPRDMFGKRVLHLKSGPEPDCFLCGSWLFKRFGAGACEIPRFGRMPLCFSLCVFMRVCKFTVLFNRNSILQYVEVVTLLYGYVLYNPRRCNWTCHGSAGTPQPVCGHCRVSRSRQLGIYLGCSLQVSRQQCKIWVH